ncbi:UDP-glucose 4-epimerase [Primorskyibacter flagellatus]|uniref:UDP-glucose 4-epimerase n=2 Tax=Primorskyibacter flagellatus TaxID=1387277 RepID=A0A1W2ELX8_9RHOB|nr:UDP-glucose 4-epimerase [Primorskyibacter flagellatus]
MGRHICKAFSADGARVTVMDVVPPPPNSPYEWISGSISDPSMMAAACVNCTTVVFLANASLPGSAIANLSNEVQSHVRDTVRAAETCGALGVNKFLFASSGGTVYGYEPADGSPLDENAAPRPRNAYGVSKLAIEHYLRLLSYQSKEMDTVSLRISNPYGEGQRATRGQGFVAAAMQNAMSGAPMEIWGDGSVERDFLHVSDVAQAFLCAEKAEEAPSVINIGSGHAVSMRDILGLVQAATERNIATTYLSGRIIDVRRNVLNIDLAQESLGWKPTVGLQAGLARTAAWWHDITQPPRSPETAP